jgi:hypothetical protein
VHKYFIWLWIHIITSFWWEYRNKTYMENGTVNVHSPEGIELFAVAGLKEVVRFWCGGEDYCFYYCFVISLLQ